jgi:hypothetical protein
LDIATAAKRQVVAAAARAEAKGVVERGGSHPHRRFAVDGDLLAAEPRLVADASAGAALALRARWP